MTRMSDASATLTTSGAERDLAELAMSLVGLVDANAEEGERRGALTEEVVGALHDAGLWAMWVPRELGGGELWPLASLDVFLHLAWADASTSWVLMAAALATGADGAFIGDEAAAQLYPRDGGRVLVHSGQGTRPGRATLAPGGLRLSGEWAFASGIKHSQIVHTGSLVKETGEVRICLLPVEQATLIDNWDVMGLRATGSIDYTLDSVFIPDGYSYPATTEVPLRGGSLYTIGIVNLAMVCHAAWALGVGRRMLDELRDLVAAKSGRPGSLADSDAFHGDFAAAEGKWRAARALVYETWHEGEETLRRGDTLSPDLQTRTRLALHHATWTVQDVCMWVYIASGTTGLRSGTIQRFFRDINAGTQHMTSAPPARQAVGRKLAGLAQGKRWVFLSLFDDD